MSYGEKKFGSKPFLAFADLSIALRQSPLLLLQEQIPSTSVPLRYLGCVVLSTVFDHPIIVLESLFDFLLLIQTRSWAQARSWALLCI
jgi:hypothetical protein